MINMTGPREPVAESRISYTKGRLALDNATPPPTESILQKLARSRSRPARGPLTKAVLGALVVAAGFFGNPTRQGQEIKDVNPPIENPTDNTLSAEARNDIVIGNPPASHGEAIPLGTRSQRDPQEKKVGDDGPINPEAIRAGEVSEEANP